MECWDIWWLDRFGSTQLTEMCFFVVDPDAVLLLVWRNFLCFRFSFAFRCVVEVRGWTGVDQLPKSLQSWFEVDPWYLDSLLKTWSESSTADPLLLEVLHIALQQFMLVTNFVFRTETLYNHLHNGIPTKLFILLQITANL